MAEKILPTGIEERVSISLAVSRYLKAADRFKDAEKEFSVARKDLAKHANKKGRFITQVDFQHYLVESKGNGLFSLEPVESL